MRDVVGKDCMSKQKIVWSNETRNIDELELAAYNPRSANENDAKNLDESLTKFNLAAPIVINKNNRVIGGHFRLSILKNKKIKSVDVRVPNRLLSDDEEKELNIRLNKNLGQWDFSKLKDFGLELLESIGFDKDELKIKFGADEINSVDSMVDPDLLNVIAVEPPGAPRLKSRRVFHCKDVQEFSRVVEFFRTEKEGILDINKLRELIGT